MSKVPKLEDFFPTEGISYDITSSQTKRFYGKVKKVGHLWITPDGHAFAKQHMAYKNVHQSYVGKDQLEQLFVPEGCTAEEFFDVRLPRILKQHYTVHFAPRRKQTSKKAFCDLFNKK